MKGKASLGIFIIVLLVIGCLLVSPAFASDVAGTIPATSMAVLDSVSATRLNSVSPAITEVGKISWSIDGLGVYPGTIGIIQVEKPAGATVRKAYMAAATTGTSAYNVQPSDIKVDGADVTWTTMVTSNMGGHNYWTDVTSLVKPKIDAAPAGRIDFTITETPTAQIDGELLVVIFDDPAQTTDNTIVLMFGAQQMGGDNFNIGLSKPIVLTDPNLALDFSLAISYSNQDNSAQYSIVDVNGIRMTSWAGGNDDSNAGMGNGNLFTVGGLDDVNTNPADPNAKPQGNKRYDDELYTLMPFVQNGDTTIAVHTENPSMDDNILFAGLYMRSATAVVGKGVVLSPASATNLVGEPHTLTAKVQDDTGAPLSGVVVTFTIKAGLNAGMTGTGTTDANGVATWTYTSSNIGTDTIVASFIDGQTTITSNEATKNWEETAIPEFPILALPVFMLIGMVFIIATLKRRKE
jgi:hypothetical protein